MFIKARSKHCNYPRCTVMYSKMATKEVDELGETNLFLNMCMGPKGFSFVLSVSFFLGNIYIFYLHFENLR